MQRTPRMVDITRKPDVVRVAIAEGFIKLRKETVERIRAGEVEKGDPLSIAALAAVLAVKNTPNTVVLAHNIPITSVKPEFEIRDDGVLARVEVTTTAKTGVEMEALTAVAAALLNIWDVVKKYEKDETGQYPHTRIEYIRVVRKIKSPSAGEA